VGFVTEHPIALEKYLARKLGYPEDLAQEAYLRLQRMQEAETLDNALGTEGPLVASKFNENINGRTHELRDRLRYAWLSQRF
jgi:hypothetical protein